ncbi:hydrogenase nickel incorporation protein HypA/HybF [Mariprofundus micogutta]|uniref:Hydrogenase maturation factor HypA n=2 Tax=Mariprofundus micogutta TaxID=1921010 RepID=A0A1L8CNM5_9PROT|nr:hydrogenase nickel incorporation protein HypA/HybF [Mariprofundus micogutta]
MDWLAALESTGGVVSIFAWVTIAVICMHELSLCEGIVEMLQDKARQEQFRRVQSIRLEIGRLSCVEVDALRFAFEAVARNSVARNAVLEIDEIPGRGFCSRCGELVEMTHRFDVCPLCGGYPVELRQGDEMRIKHVEVL